MTLTEELRNIDETKLAMTENNSDLVAIFKYASDSQKKYDITEISRLIFKCDQDKKLPNGENLNQDIRYTFETLLNMYVVNIEKHSIDYWLYKKGKTLTELGKQADISKKGIYDIRKGISEPKYSTLERIAKALDIPITQLQTNGGYGEMRTKTNKDTNKGA